MPPWLHRDPCRFSADTGLGARLFGWLTKRGLSMHQLDTELTDRLHHPLLKPAGHRGDHG
jgi:hypothetical protein